MLSFSLSVKFRALEQGRLRALGAAASLGLQAPHFVGVGLEHGWVERGSSEEGEQACRVGTGA